jgi:talin
VEAGNYNKQNLVAYSKNVANAVADIIRLAESLKSDDEWVDPEDPTSVAESELLGAADAIESAAKKLARLKPRAKNEVCLNFFLIISSSFNRVIT